MARLFYVLCGRDGLCIVFRCKNMFFLKKQRISAVFLIKRACFVEKRCVVGVGVLFWRWNVRKSVGVGSCA